MAAALESRLSDAEINDLAKIAGTMVPEDTALRMPGADDPVILDDIVRSVGRDLPLVREALAAIAAKSGGTFADMERDAREALINDWYASGWHGGRRSRAGDRGRLLSRRSCPAGLGA